MRSIRSSSRGDSRRGSSTSSHGITAGGRRTRSSKEAKEGCTGTMATRTIAQHIHGVIMH